MAVAIPAVPLVGALAVSAAAATGALPLPGDSGPRQQVTTVETVATPGAPVATTFRQFESVVDSDASASQVVAAAAKLHQQLAALMASTPDDPARARVVANLLQLEQDLLLRKQPPGTSIVLAASRRLVAQLLGSSAGSSPANVHPSPTTVLLPTR